MVVLSSELNVIIFNHRIGDELFAHGFDRGHGFCLVSFGDINFEILALTHVLDRKSVV